MKNPTKPGCNMKCVILEKMPYIIIFLVIFQIKVICHLNPSKGLILTNNLRNKSLSTFLHGLGLVA